MQRNSEVECVAKLILLGMILYQTCVGFMDNIIDSPKGSYAKPFFYNLLLVYAVLYAVQLVVVAYEHYTMAVICFVLKVLFTTIDTIMKIVVMLDPATAASHYDHLAIHLFASIYDIFVIVWMLTFLMELRDICNLPPGYRFKHPIDNTNPSKTDRTKVQ